MSDPKECQRRSPESAATPAFPPSGQPPCKVDESVWQVAQIATSLLCGSASPGQVPPKGWVWSDNYFTTQVDDALRKARVILDRASRPNADGIRLHEYFQPGEVLNASKIVERLGEIGWWSASRPTMDVRLDAIRDKWSSRLEGLNEAFPETQTKRQQVVLDLERMLDEFCRRDGVNELLPQSAEHSRALLSELRRGFLFSDEEMRTVEYEREKSLFDWCFRSGGSLDGRPNPSKLYRFHELLRVAEAYGWLPVEFSRPQGPIFEKGAGLPPFYAIPLQVSFEAFNSDGVKSALTSYPWEPPGVRAHP